VGFVDSANDSYLIAAGDPDADWARNLEEDPRCTITVGDDTFAAIAEALDVVARNATVAGLILKYGTPAERLGRGSAFRLRRTGPREERAP
jgi:hypothetical protein